MLDLLFFMLLMIVFHEVGHYLYAISMGLEPKFGFDGINPVVKIKRLPPNRYGFLIGLVASWLILPLIYVYNPLYFYLFFFSSFGFAVVDIMFFLVFDPTKDEITKKLLFLSFTFVFNEKSE